MSVVRFERLAIQGFKSYGKDQVFAFPRKLDGFYLLTGENKIEPELGPNGSGKSALWGALCWVLFGKDPRGLKAKDVANRSGEHLTSSCLEFSLDGEVYGLTRTWNPNSLTIDLPEKTKPTIIQQDELEALIGCNYESFLNTVLIGQFNLAFFDLPPANKMESISDILELGVWEQATNRAKLALRSLESAKSLEQSELSRLQGALYVTEEQILAQETAASRFEGARGEDSAEAEAQLALAKREAGKCFEAEADLDMKVQALEQKQTSKKEKTGSLLRKQDKARNLYQEVVGARKIFCERLEFLANRRERLDKIKGSCPMCEQEIPLKHKGKIFELVHDEELNIKREITNAKLEEEGALGKLREIEQQQRELQEELNVYLEARQEIDSKKLRLAEKLGAAKEKIKYVERQLATLATKANPHTTQLASLRRDAAKTTKEIEVQRVSLQQVAEDTLGTEFWISSFKDIRLWIIKQAITEFEFHVNNYLEELGLAGYQIHFDIERAKQDGSGVMKGFHVFITSPHSEDAIPWESWSGGETQRLRLAGTLGLSDMITGRTGFQPSCEVWDEPTTHLSQEGITDLLTLLAARAKLRKRQIWLVDHRSLDAGDFDDEVRVTKDENGSHVVQRQPKTTRPSTRQEEPRSRLAAARSRIRT